MVITRSGTILLDTGHPLSHQITPVGCMNGCGVLLQVIQTITPYIEREDFDPAAIKKVILEMGFCGLRKLWVMCLDG